MTSSAVALSCATRIGCPRYETSLSAVTQFSVCAGNHARRVANALSLDADAVILDLEDAVATAEKPAGDRTVNRARQGVTADSLILSGRRGHRRFRDRRPLPGRR